MPDVYRSADIFTLVSEESEAFGIAFVEAMATNLGIVTINDDPRKEIVANAGILVDPSDITSYANALDKALKKDWKNKPRNKAKKFSWEIVVTKYDKLFSDLIK